MHISPSTARRSTLPSYLVKPGDVIEVKESSRASSSLRDLWARMPSRLPFLSGWIVKKNALKGTVVKMPERGDIDMPIEEHLIVELYSK